MKIAEPFGHEPTNSGMRKRRMEALLTAWRQQPMWLPADALSFASALPEEAKFTADEWLTWIEIVREADPAPPRTKAGGLDLQARVSGRSVADLVASKVVLRIGNRVSTRWLAGGAGLGGHSWSLVIPTTDRDATATAREGVLRKRFREVARHDAVLLASEPLGAYLDTLPLLLADATNVVPDRDALFRLWMLARALHVDEAFLLQLTQEAKASLAGRLGGELVEAANDLDVRTDLRLALFAEGQGDEVPEHFLTPPLLPGSRLADLLTAANLLEHTHSEIADHYYEDVATAYALIAETFPLGETLKRLPAGRTLFAVVEQICMRRPELIATFVWHMAFHAEGAFALLQLPQKRQLPQAHVLDLAEEWLEVQRLGREQIVLADRAEDWRSIIALGIHDESERLARRHFGVRPSLLQQVPLEDPATWIAAVAVAERAKTVVDVLDGYFRERTKRGDAAIVFSLRLLAPLRERGSLEVARQLARAIVGGYKAALTLDYALLSIPSVLCAYGPLLEDLRVALLDDNVADDCWTTWLRPFDVAAYVETARAAVGMGVDSRTLNPAYDVPHVFRAHVETLVAQASTLGEAAGQQAGALIDAAIDLYIIDRKANLEAFSWYALSRTLPLRPAIGCEPVFVSLGRVLARTPGGSERLGRLLAEQPQAHVLAYLLLGLSGEGTQADAVRPALRASINELLGPDRGLALGHALELANILHQAAMPRDAERLARRVLEIAQRLRPHERAPYTDAALAILAGALAQQELWAELLSFTPEVHGQAQQQFVKNMRALALMASGRLLEAKELLDQLLGTSPTDPTALANLVVLHLRRGDWAAAIEAAAHAKRLLPPSQWDIIIVNEALAREQLGDKFTASALMQSLSSESRHRASVRDVVKRFESGAPSKARGGVPPSADPPPHDATQVPDSPLTKDPLPPPPEPSDAVDVAIVTALQVEYEAVRDRLTNWGPAPSHPEFTNLFGWTVGTVPKTDGSGQYRVVVAMAGDSGNLRTEYATKRTIDRWRPRYVLFSGIAGGLHRSEEDPLTHGDVVVSQTIWHYEYQKIVDGQHVPRARDTFQADPGLVNAARAFDSASKSIRTKTKTWRDCGVIPPVAEHVPKFVLGVIGSGEKVIDDLEPPFVRAIRAFKPELQAVEMEAAGACMAIEFAQAEGKCARFMMVRGISDMPKAPSAASKLGALKTIFSGPFGSILGRIGSAGGGAGTATRDNWKPYASAISAHFIATLMSSGWWPEAPR